MLGPILFNIFTSDLDDGAECFLYTSDNDTKLRGLADRPGACAAIQRDLSRLEEWADGDLVEFNKRKCGVIHLKKNNPIHQYMFGADHLESNFCRKRPLCGTWNLLMGHEPAMCPC